MCASVTTENGDFMFHLELGARDTVPSYLTLMV